jgi:hypothetical protein
MALSIGNAHAAQAIARLDTALDRSDPANFPAAQVQVPRTGLRQGIGIPGLVVGGAGIAGVGVSLVRQLTSGGALRLHMPTMLALGAATLLGGAAFGASRLIGPSSRQALAANIPTRDLAEQVERRISGRTKVVECTDGSFAVLRDTTPVSTGGSGGSRRPSSSGGSSRPSNSGSNAPSYPSTGGGGSTSRGDDSGSSRNSSSNGNPSSDDF